MKLAASNIAWPFARRIEAYAILARHGFAGLEIAPALLLGEAADPFEPDAAQLDQALGELAEHGLMPVSMQSLLFGVEGAALFGTAVERQRLTAGIDRAIGLAARLGIPTLVFGSPLQRVVPAGRAREQAEDEAAALFRDLGRRALDHGARIALEPNPAAYGTNFLTTLAETEAFVCRVDHPGVRLNFDLGAVTMNAEGEDVADFLGRSADLVGHVHVSAPHLAPAPTDAVATARVLAMLARAGYGGWHSIEMRSPADRDPIESLDHCAQCLAKAAAAAQALQ